MFKIKINATSLLIILTGIVLTACSTQKSEKSIHINNTDNLLSKIYFYREYSAIGGTSIPTIYINEKEVAKLPRSTITSVIVSPGKKYITLKHHKSEEKLDDLRLEVDVEPGKDIYIQNHYSLDELDYFPKNAAYPSKSGSKNYLVVEMIRESNEEGSIKLADQYKKLYKYIDAERSKVFKTQDIQNEKSTQGDKHRIKVEDFDPNASPLTCVKVEEEISILSAEIEKFRKDLKNYRDSNKPYVYIGNVFYLHAVLPTDSSADVIGKIENMDTARDKLNAFKRIRGCSI